MLSEIPTILLGVLLYMLMVRTYHLRKVKVKHWVHTFKLPEVFTNRTMKALRKGSGESRKDQRQNVRY